MFYIEKEYTKGHKQIDTIDGIDNIEPLSLDGKSLKNHDSTLNLYLKNDNGFEPDFLIGGTVLPIISNKVKELLEKNSNKEYLEFINFNNNNKYYILNVLNNLKCFDWDNSTYTKYPDSMKELSEYPESIDDLVLLDKVIEGRSIFRMEEDSTELFITDEMKKLLEMNNISGLAFRELSEFEKW